MTKSLFTEDDARRMDCLPTSERHAFLNRFAQIAMSVKIADDKWEETRQQADTTLAELITDIKARLERD